MSQCAKALHDANIAIKSLHFPAFFALVRLFYPLVCLFSAVGECFFQICIRDFPFCRFESQLNAYKLIKILTQ